MKLKSKFDETSPSLNWLNIKSVVKVKQTATTDETLQHVEGAAESSPKNPFDVIYYTDFWRSVTDVHYFSHLHKGFTSKIIFAQQNPLLCGVRNLLELTPLKKTCQVSLSKNANFRRGSQINQQINSMRQILLQKLVNKFPALYSARMYIAKFTSACTSPSFELHVYYASHFIHFLSDQLRY
jgi:hypothetical protein